MKYHLEGLINEGVDNASQEDLEADVEMSETEKLIDTWLQENLTVVQYQRFKLFMEGLSIREIAKTEGIDYSSAMVDINSSHITSNSNTNTIVFTYMS